MKIKLPEGWSWKTIDEIKSDKPYSYTGGPFGSDLKSSDYVKEGIRIIQLQNIGDGKFMNSYKIFTTKGKANQLLACNIYPNDIIIAKMAAPVARACIIPSFHDRYLMASDGIRLNVNKKICDNIFIYSMINHPIFRRQAINKSLGTTRARIGLTELKKIPFPFPPFEQQTKIAKILTTIDNVIEKTEAAIAKYQAIKQGMMHDLFTHGIGANGQLRPSYADAPELYKESALGWIPKEWNCEQLDEYITFKMYGPRFSAKDYNKQGNVKTIRGMDFTKNGEILYDQAPIALLPKNLVKAHELQERDVIVVTTADCGITAVFRDQGFPYIPSAYTVKYKFNEKMNPYFFKFQMETYAAMAQVEKYIRKGTLANLPGSDLLNFWMNIPKEEEQIKIVERLERVNSKIAIEKQTLLKQMQLKQGLMQDLLTGKVPVKAELINA